MTACIILLAMLQAITGTFPPSREGSATWYPADGYVAAAGPGLRHWLADWRGSTVKVCSSECVTVKLVDWCACPHHTLIDLGSEAFASLADLRTGRIHVTVTRITAPATDTAP